MGVGVVTCTKAMRTEVEIMGLGVDGLWGREASSGELAVRQVWAQVTPAWWPCMLRQGTRTEEQAVDASELPEALVHQWFKA